MSARRWASRVLSFGLPLLAGLLSLATVWHLRTATSRFALAVVDAARSPAGLPASLVDEDLVERLRRVELVRRLSVDTGDRDRLLEALRGELGPDRKYPPDERPRRQRERAQGGLRAMLAGACRAEPWPEGAASWVARVTGPGLTRLPDEAVAEQRHLREALQGAEGARVTCASGEVGLLIVPGAFRGARPRPWSDAWGGRRVADIFPTRTSVLGISPFDPAMK